MREEVLPYLQREGPLRKPHSAAPSRAQPRGSQLWSDMPRVGIGQTSFEMTLRGHFS